jgi:hypothetical protein
MPADTYVDANDTTIVPAEPEKPDQSLLTLKDRLDLGIEQQKKLPSNDVDENKTKELVKVIKREMKYFENVNIREKYLRCAFEYLNTIYKCEHIF